MDGTSSKLVPVAVFYETCAKIEEDGIRYWKYIVCLFDLIIKNSMTPEKWFTNESNIAHLK
jgi:hypothetical protein